MHRRQTLEWILDIRTQAHSHHRDAISSGFAWRSGIHGRANRDRRHCDDRVGGQLVLLIETSA